MYNTYIHIYLSFSYQGLNESLCAVYVFCLGKNAREEKGIAVYTRCTTIIRKRIIRSLPSDTVLNMKDNLMFFFVLYNPHILLGFVIEIELIIIISCRFAVHQYESVSCLNYFLKSH